MILDNLNGNNNIKSQLLSLEKSNRMPHAIILEGGTADQRDILADIISGWAVCSCDNEKPCGNCCNCVKIKSASHPDVLKICGDKGAKALHIEAIRNIRQDAYIKPNEARNKVYILSNADNMTQQAQNALLKVLEEPPNNVIFILTCDSAFSLLLTIRSRAQILSLDPVESDNISEKSMDISNQIALALLERKEFELLCATSKFGKDKLLMKETLQVFIDLLMQACRGISGINIEGKSDTALKICRGLTSSTIMRLIEVSQTCINMVDSNVNVNILTTYLCCSLYRQAVLQ